MRRTILLGLLAVLILVGFMFFGGGGSSGTAINSVPFVEESEFDTASVETSLESEGAISDDSSVSESTTHTGANTTKIIMSSRQINIAERINLPVSGSAPTENVKHSIPIEEIRQGCFRQDCIPSVDNPTFVSVSEANDILPDDTVGIALSYKGVERFYPFNMLVTREIVNDVVAGDPLLITYCPLCGTGIVFDRKVDGTTFEFGVSGMLWQSNLLMYNRTANLSDRNLWSQVLGEAVVGPDTGTKLAILPSDIMKYTVWREDNTGGEVLNTGRIGDPYGGDYYGVASRFSPNFDEANSALDPSAYVFGVEVEGSFKAYPRDALPFGVTTDTISGTTLTITKSENGNVTIVDETGTTVPDIEGFWFSWVAAHPDTELWRN